MDLPITCIFESPLSFLGESGMILNLIFYFFLFLFFFIKFLYANRIAPDATPCSAVSHLRLYCLLLSNKKDARFKRVKVCMIRAYT